MVSLWIRNSRCFTVNKKDKGEIQNEKDPWQMDMEELVRHNQEKMKKQMEKRGVSAQQINQQARMNARNIQAPDKTSGLSQEEKAAQRKKATEYYNNANVKPGSLAAKANMVKQFDEKNTKKK